MQEKIQQQLMQILAEMGVFEVVPQVSLSQSSEHGEFSTNLAMVLSKKLQKNPLEVAEEVAKELRIKNEELRILEKIEVVKPGFVNFFVNKAKIVKQIESLINSEKKVGIRGKKIIVEFTDPNPFKEFHIGHLYSNIVGESVSRLLESQDMQVTRVCYQGDVGLHVAKAIWGLRKNFKEKGVRNGEYKLYEQSSTPNERAFFLGQSYSLGAKAYEEDSTAKDEIIAINKMVYERSDKDINELYDFGKKWSLEYFNSIYQRLGTKFERFYFESEVSKDGIDTVNKGLDEGIFTKENGAVIFKGENYGLHTRVFLNSLGLPTYEAKELGLALRKEHELAPDLSIIITGNEIQAYFKVLLKVLSLMSPQLQEKTRHITHGMVRLAEGKMSSRLGNVLTGEWLLDETKKHIKDQFPDMNYITSEQVTIGAVKYALLKGSIGHDIAFNFKESVSLEGNSGPYMQYVYVRCMSILNKAEIQGVIERESSSWRIDRSNLVTGLPRSPDKSGSLAMTSEEFELMRQLSFYEIILKQAAKELAPHILCTYLFDLAQLFNHFYQNVPVLNAENEEQKQFRLLLVEATASVIKQGLNILGIQTPERM